MDETGSILAAASQLGVIWLDPMTKIVFSIRMLFAITAIVSVIIAVWFAPTTFRLVYKCGVNAETPNDDLRLNAGSHVTIVRMGDTKGVSTILACATVVRIHKSVGDTQTMEIRVNYIQKYYLSNCRNLLWLPYIDS